MRTTMWKGLGGLAVAAAGVATGAQAQAQDQEKAQGLQWSDGAASASLYGTLDIGYVGRRGGNGAVADMGTQNDLQSAAGSDGSNVGLKLGYDLGNGTRLIGEVEVGVDLTGDKDAGSGGDTFYTRHAWLGATGDWGTLLGGTVDGGRAAVLKQYDPFKGRSVASAGSLQVVVSRAKDAVVYVTPTWRGLNATFAYTPNLLGVSDRDSRSPLYAVILAYSNGPLSLGYDHEEEWWNDVPGLTRLRINLFGASYDVGPIKLYGFYERIDIQQPFDVAALGFYHEHKGYLLGFTAPMGANGLWKAAWSRRDSSYVDNTCNKWGVGYQHALSPKAYLYADYARIDNGVGGTCTIAYSNEQTSADLGQGDAGGYGIEGVDVGLVLKF
jgi:predicted porin